MDVFQAINNLLKLILKKELVEKQTKDYIPNKKKLV